MKKYTVEESPEFHEEIDICETKDTNHADNINAGPKQTFENTLFNRKSIEELQNRSLSDEDGVDGIRFCEGKLQRYDADSETWVDVSEGGIHIGDSPPDDTKLLWVDTGNDGISKYYNGDVWVAVKSDDSDSKGGGIHIGTTAPEDTGLLWIDTGNGGISKYYNGAAWVPTKAVWG